MGNDDNNETPKEALDNTDGESVQNDIPVKSEETQDSGNLDPEDSVLSETIEEQQGTDSTYSTEDNLEKMILSTGIRVGTPVKTKYMAPFIVRANPEGLYILDISKTLARIDIAAKFIGRSDISRVAVASAREYGKTPVEKFCELNWSDPNIGQIYARHIHKSIIA